MAEFRQKITLEGADQLLQQLKKIGDDGSKAFQQLQVAINGTNSTLGRLSQTVNGIQTSVQAFGRQLSSVAAAVTPFSSSMSGLISTLGAFAGPAGLVAATGGLVLFLRNLADTTDQVRRSAAALGLLPDQLIAISKAVKPAGIGIEELVTALTRFNQKAAAEAKQQFSAVTELAGLLGTKLRAPGFGAGILTQTFDDLEKLRVAVKPAAAQMRSFFESIAKPFQRVPALFELEQALFNAGRRTDEFGEKVRNLLRDMALPAPTFTGPEAIQNALKDLEPTLTALGIRLRDDKNQTIDTFEALLRLADAFDKLPAGMRKTAIEAGLLGRSLGPELAQAIEQSGGRKNIEAIRAALEGIEARMQAARELKQQFQQLDDAAKSFGNSLLTSFGPELTRQLQLAARDIQEFKKNNFSVDVDFAQSPLAKAFSAEGLKEAFNALITGARRDFDNLVNLTQERATSVGQAVSQFAQSSASTVQGFIEGAIGVISRLWGGLKDGASQAFQFIVNLAVKLPADLQAALAGVASVPGSIWDGLKNSAQQAWQAVVQLFATLPQAIASAVSGLADVITAPFQQALSTIRDIFNQISELIQGIKSGLQDATQGADQGVTGGEFASGGFVRGPGTGKSDSIVARLGRSMIRLSNGEFVVQADAVRELMRRYGSGIMWAINRGELPLPKFSMGGFVDRVNASLADIAMPGFAGGGFPALAPAGGGSQVFLSFNGGQRVGPFSGSDDAVKALTKAAVSSSMFSAQRRQSSVK